MAMRSYNSIYLSDVSENLGAMMEYSHHFGYDPETFWNDFISSLLAKEIENGNPKYLSGYSGKEYFLILLEKRPAEEKRAIPKKEYVLSFDRYYWIGWVLAQLQHKTGYSFSRIVQSLPFSRVLELYPALHEADITRFYDAVMPYFEQEKEETRLKKLREIAGYSQSQLARESQVDLRSIQMYEQRRNDINKAQGDTLRSLSKALNCRIEDLLED